MPAELLDAGLDELDRMRVVRGEGAFEGLSQSLQALPYIEMFERKKYNYLNPRIKGRKCSGGQ